MVDKVIKQKVGTLLRQRDYDELLALCRDDRQAWKALHVSLYETDESLVWPAIETVALMMKSWWDLGEKEKVREFIRGQLWSLNDESGGIGWNAPQTIAEIIILIPELIEPYGSMLIDRTMEESLLVKNGLWAIGRLGERIGGAIIRFEGVVLQTLKSEDPNVIGVAAWAMGQAGFTPALPFLEALKARKEPVRIYINGGYVKKSLEQWAIEAIARIASIE